MVDTTSDSEFEKKLIIANALSRSQGGKTNAAMFDTALTKGQDPRTDKMALPDGFLNPGSTDYDYLAPNADRDRLLDIISRGSLSTDLSAMITDTFHGHGIFGTAPIPINKEHFGHTFFTRPNMFLAGENLYSNRKLAQLDTNKANTMGSAIRAYLDPRSQNTGVCKAEQVDAKNAFISLLSNTLENLSGWPDPTIDTFTATPGLRKETWAMYDGIYEIWNEFPLTATFKNMVNDPITQLFDIWLQYGSGVRIGTMEPRVSAQINREIDYQTRIWRIILNSTRTHVAKIASCIAAIPVGISLGKAFDYQRDKPLNQGNDSINVQFLCVGAMYNDPILFREFNDTVCAFNPGMKDGPPGETGPRDGLYQKVPAGLTPLFNYKCYPRINLDTLEMEWYVDQNLYVQMLGLDANDGGQA